MTSRLRSLSTAEAARDEMMMLALVNVLQPVTYEALAKFVSEDISRSKLWPLIRSLRNRELLTTLQTEEYVVTPKGRAAIFTPALRKRRDISRMRYLFFRSRGGGGTSGT
jgi:hypothetical protein